jgi:hypothetical protein
MAYDLPEEGNTKKLFFLTEFDFLLGRKAYKIGWVQIR